MAAPYITMIEVIMMEKGAPSVHRIRHRIDFRNKLIFMNTTRVLNTRMFPGEVGGR